MVRLSSVCSGVGGMDLGLERAGFKLSWLCEIDPACRSVLRRHWPNVPIHEDLTELGGGDVSAVDLLAGGTPCQDLSVAGRGAGLDGEKSGLFHDFVRLAREIAAPWLLWENVAGALSSCGGEDFATVIESFTGWRPSVPANGWRSAGGCSGPVGQCVWRVLDAQYFGVPQRRRRVFVVVRVGGICPPEVLLEPESVCGDPSASREAGEVASALTAPSTGGGRLDDGEVNGRLVVAKTTNIGKLGTLTAGTSSTQGIPFEISSGRPCRLTPRECERLMGWPDDRTRWGSDGREMSDSARYRMTGNGMVSPVAEWIGRRILKAGP